MTENPETFVKEFVEAITAKRTLVDTIGRQMASDVDKGLLSIDTLQAYTNAKNSLDASLLHLERKEFQEAIYLFSRGCWNLGEFKGRSDFEKKAT